MLSQKLLSFYLKIIKIQIVIVLIFSVKLIHADSTLTNIVTVFLFMNKDQFDKIPNGESAGKYLWSADSLHDEKVFDKDGCLDLTPQDFPEYARNCVVDKECYFVFCSFSAIIKRDVYGVITEYDNPHIVSFAKANLNMLRLIAGDEHADIKFTPDQIFFAEPLSAIENEYKIKIKPGVVEFHWEYTKTKDFIYETNGTRSVYTFLVYKRTSWALWFPTALYSISSNDSSKFTFAKTAFGFRNYPDDFTDFYWGISVTTNIDLLDYNASDNNLKPYSFLNPLQLGFLGDINNWGVIGISYTFNGGAINKNWQVLFAVSPGFIASLQIPGISFH